MTPLLNYPSLEEVFVPVELSDEGSIRGNSGVHSRDILAQRMLHVPKAYLCVSKILPCVPYPVVVTSKLDVSTQPTRDANHFSRIGGRAPYPHTPWNEK